MPPFDLHWLVNLIGRCQCQHQEGSVIPRGFWFGRFEDDQFTPQEQGNEIRIVLLGENPGPERARELIQAWDANNGAVGQYIPQQARILTRYANERATGYWRSIAELLRFGQFNGVFLHANTYPFDYEGHQEHCVSANRVRIVKALITLSLPIVTLGSVADEALGDHPHLVIGHPSFGRLSSNLRSFESIRNLPPDFPLSIPRWQP